MEILILFIIILIFIINKPTQQEKRKIKSNEEYMQDLKLYWDSCPKEDNRPKIINGKIVLDPIVTVIDVEEKQHEIH